MISLDRRASGSERMDAPGVSEAEMTDALDDLVDVAYWLGGRRGLLRQLTRLLPARAEPYRLLDVGVGGGDLTAALAAALADRGVHAHFIGLDLHPTTLRLARRRQPHLPLVRGNALRLPFAPGAFDVALCATTLHHFTDPEAVQVLREMSRVSRRGLLVSDLGRSRPAYLGARLLARTLWRRSRLTRHDGPLSVRRAFRPSELRRIASEAGLYGARVRREPVFRLSLRWVRPA